MNKKLIRLTESDLHRIVKESVNRILKEEMGLKHHSHNYDEYLDDNDFLTVVKMVEPYYPADEIIKSDNVDEIEYEIEGMVKEFIYDETETVFGPKYGGGDARKTASNIIDYIVNYMEK